MSFSELLLFVLGFTKCTINSPFGQSVTFGVRSGIVDRTIKTKYKHLLLCNKYNPYEMYFFSVLDA